MEKSTFRVLVVDDYERWRAFVASTLQKLPELLIIGEAADGLEAVQIAQQLQPDLILLDIGLPTLNGVMAARRIKEVCPQSKILFVSENRSRDIAQEALGTGAGGYVVKSNAATELLPALEAVLQGKQFVSGSLTGPAFLDQVALSPQNTSRRHEVCFYSDDRRLLDEVTQFIGAALRAGNVAIVVATESHRHNLIPRLQAEGVDIGAAIEQGRYIALDVADTLSMFMVEGTLDPVRFMENCGNLIGTAMKASRSELPRVAFFGEGTHLLWTDGNIPAALEDEKLCNELTKIYDIDILCGYSVGSAQGAMEAHVFQQICAEHSAVHNLEAR